MEGDQSQMTGEVKKWKVKYSTKHHVRSKCLVPSPTWEGRVVWGWLGVRNPNVVVVDVKVGGVGRRGNLNKMMLNSTRIQNIVQKIPACVGIDHFRGLSICPSVYKLVTIGYRRALVHRIRIFTKKKPTTQRKNQLHRRCKSSFFSDALHPFNNLWFPPMHIASL